MYSREKGRETEREMEIESYSFHIIYQSNMIYKPVLQIYPYIEPLMHTPCRRKIYDFGNYNCDQRIGYVWIRILVPRSKMPIEKQNIVLLSSDPYNLNV